MAKMSLKLSLVTTMATQPTRMTRVVPKSGWRKMSKAGGKKERINQKSLFFTLLTAMLQKVMIKNGLMISDGWREKVPI